MTARCSKPEMICLQCGDRGWSNAFVYCVKCLNVSVHRYCLDVIPNTSDELVRWICDDCSSAPSNLSFVTTSISSAPSSSTAHATLETGSIPTPTSSASTGEAPAPTPSPVLFRYRATMELAESSISSHEEVEWIRPTLRHTKPTVNLYSKLEICTTIKDSLGQDAQTLFRRGCFGHFLDFKGDKVNKRALHALLCQEVRVSEPEFVGRECHFYINGNLVRIGPSEFNLLTGLRFGRSSFDPNSKVQIPETGIYYRIFQGQRTLLPDMHKRLVENRLAGRTHDQVKVANILIVYNMLLCPDQRKKFVDDWVWALVEDEEQWNNFPWGAYTFQLMLHFISKVAKTRSSMGGNNKDGTYHFYGPTWILEIWMAEILPQLNGSIVALNGYGLRPRCLKWTLLENTSDDFVHFFDERVQVNLMIPSPEEVQSSYYYGGKGDPLGVKYEIPRRGPKKKIGNITPRAIHVSTTCGGTNDVVGPSTSDGTPRSACARSDDVGIPFTLVDTPRRSTRHDRPGSPLDSGGSLPTRQLSKHHRKRSSSDQETSSTLFDRLTQYIDQRCTQTELYIEARIEKIEDKMTSNYQDLRDLISTSLTSHNSSPPQPKHVPQHTDDITPFDNMTRDKGNNTH